VKLTLLKQSSNEEAIDERATRKGYLLNDCLAETDVHEPLVFEPATASWREKVGLVEYIFKIIRASEVVNHIAVRTEDTKRFIQLEKIRQHALFVAVPCSQINIPHKTSLGR